ncbi:hypothetical protein [Tortoise microvirus 107]|nr:hypothetical protein [Tortoise microvirus 107]
MKSVNTEVKDITDGNFFERLSSRFRSHYMLYDTELDAVLESFEHVYDVLKRVKKRFLRNESCRIAKSLVQYMQLQKDRAEYPYELYDFRCDRCRICVGKLDNLYHVFVDGFVPPNFSPSYGSKCLYGTFADVGSAVLHFHEIVLDYLHHTVGGFNFGL